MSSLNHEQHRWPRHFRRRWRRIWRTRRTCDGSAEATRAVTELANALTARRISVDAAVWSAVGDPMEATGGAVHDRFRRPDCCHRWCRYEKRTVRVELHSAATRWPKSVEFRIVPIPLSGALKPLKRELRYRTGEATTQGCNK